MNGAWDGDDAFWAVNEDRARLCSMKRPPAGGLCSSTEDSSASHVTTSVTVPPFSLSSPYAVCTTGGIRFFSNRRELLHTWPVVISFSCIEESDDLSKCEYSGVCVTKSVG